MPNLGPRRLSCCRSPKSRCWTAAFPWCSSRQTCRSQSREAGGCKNGARALDGPQESRTAASRKLCPTLVRPWYKVSLGAGQLLKSCVAVQGWAVTCDHFGGAQLARKHAALVLADRCCRVAELVPRGTHFVRCKKTNVVELGSLHKLSLGRPWLPPRRARGGRGGGAVPASGCRRAT